MLSILTLPFIQKALIAGLALGAILPFLGAFVVLKRMSFFGDGIAHASLAGVALGVLAGFNPFWTALGVAVVFAVAIYFLERRTTIGSDALIGLIFTAGLALGVVLLSFQAGYQPELISFLFGNILTISGTDITLIGSFAVLIIAFLFYFLREFTLIILDRDTAWLRGISVTVLELFFYIILSVAIVLGVKLLGIILVSALLITPPTIGKLIAQSFKGLLISSVIAGEISIVMGLIASYYFDIPTGATIILTATALFLIVFLLTQLRGGTQQTR